MLWEGMSYGGTCLAEDMSYGRTCFTQGHVFQDDMSYRSIFLIGGHAF